MSQSKRIVTTLLVAGFALAACQPRATTTIKTVASDQEQASAQNGNAIQINEVKRAEAQVEPIQGVDDTATPQPQSTYVQVASPTPDDHGQNSGLDSTQDALENANQTSTPQATVNNLGQELEFTGTLSQIGASFIVVNGQTVFMGAGTEVKGALTVGALVKVHAFIDGNGALSAREIELATAVGGVDDNGQDDPNTHDVGDDNGQDDPNIHDVGDDHGGDNNQNDDGDNSGPGSTNSGHADNSGHNGNDDNGQHSGGDDNGGHGGGH